MTNAGLGNDQTVDHMAGVHRLRRAAEDVEAAPAEGLFREQRMDLVRRAEALRRMADVAAEHAMRPRGSAQRPRVLIAHQQGWFATALAAGLERQGIEVVGVVADGADAVGLSVAARPDVLLIETVLSRMTGIEVLQDLQTFATDARTVVRVAHSDGVNALLAAGATAVWLRSVKPEQVAEDLAQLVRQPA